MVVVISRKLPLGTGHCTKCYCTIHRFRISSFATTRELDVYSAYVLLCASGVRLMISWDRMLSVESPPFQRREAQAQKPFHRKCWSSISGWTRTLLAEYTHAY